jgi:hypothetical protein
MLAKSCKFSLYALKCTVVENHNRVNVTEIDTSLNLTAAKYSVSKLLIMDKENVIGILRINPNRLNACKKEKST